MRQHLEMKDGDAKNSSHWKFSVPFFSLYMTKEYFSFIHWERKLLEEGQPRKRLFLFILRWWEYKQNLGYIRSDLIVRSYLLSDLWSAIVASKCIQEILNLTPGSTDWSVSKAVVSQRPHPCPLAFLSPFLNSILWSLSIILYLRYGVGSTA